jgi:hypothetical protein
MKKPNPKQNAFGVTRVDAHEPEHNPSDQELINRDDDSLESRVAKAKQLIDAQVAWSRDEEIIPDVDHLRTFLLQIRELLGGAEAVKPDH